MALDVPSSLLADISAAIRSDLSLPSPSSSPLPSVAQAIAGLASAHAGDAGATLICVRCGLPGLLRGARSADCSFCGAVRGEAEGMVFRDTASCRGLLGSLGLDGSEPICLDAEPTGSNKSNDMPPSGMILSDLLDIKLIRPPDNKETVASSSSEMAASTYAAYITGADLATSFSENTRVLSKEFQPSEVNAASLSSNFEASSHSFANWEADFQGGSNNGAVDSERSDLFQSSLAKASDDPPNVRFTDSSGGKDEHVIIVDQSRLEVSESTDHHPLPGGASNIDNEPDDWQEFHQAGEQPAAVSSTGEIPESIAIRDPFKVNNVDSWSSSIKEAGFLEQPKVEGDGNTDDFSFDDWEEFTSNTGRIQPSDTAGAVNYGRSQPSATADLVESENVVDGMQSVLPNTSLNISELVVPVLFGNHPEMNDTDLFPSTSKASEAKEAMDYVNDKGIFDDWEEYNSMSKDIGISSDSSNVLKIDELFDDKQSFSSSREHASFSNRTDSMAVMDLFETDHVSSWASSMKSSELKEPRDKNGDIFDDWLSSTFSSGTQSLRSIGTINIENKDAVFDDRQNFTSAGEQQAGLGNTSEKIESKIAHNISDSTWMDLWPSSTKTITVEEPKNDGAAEDGTFDGFQAFASSWRSHTEGAHGNESMNNGDMSADYWKEFSNVSGHKDVLSMLGGNMEPSMVSGTSETRCMDSSPAFVSRNEVAEIFPSESESAHPQPSRTKTFEVMESLDNGLVETESKHQWPSSTFTFEVKEPLDRAPSETVLNMPPSSMNISGVKEPMIDDGVGLDDFDDWQAFSSNAKSSGGINVNSSGEAIEDWYGHSAVAGQVFSSDSSSHIEDIDGAHNVNNSVETIKDQHQSAAAIVQEAPLSTMIGHEKSPVTSDPFEMNFFGSWSGTTRTLELEESKKNDIPEIKSEDLCTNSLELSGTKETLDGNGEIDDFDDWQAFKSNSERSCQGSANSSGNIVKTAKAVDDWYLRELSNAGKQQISQFKAGKHMESTLLRPSSETCELVTSGMQAAKEVQSVDNGAIGAGDYDFFNDWQSFTVNSDRRTLASPSGGRGGILTELSFEAKSVDIKGLNNTEALNETSDFGDWEEYVGSDHVSSGLGKSNEMTETSLNRTTESKSETLVLTEGSNSLGSLQENINPYDDDDWQEFASFSQPHGTSVNLWK